jgi:hypothetical protein
MQPNERREWEAIAYGRDATDAQRNEAVRRLAEPSGPLPMDAVESREPARRRRRGARPWIVAAGSILLLAVGVTAFVLAAPRNSDEPAAGRPVGLSPARESDLPGGNPVDRDALDNVELLSIESVLAPETITGLTDLGAGHGGATAWGVLSSGQQVCVILREADTGSTRCTTLTDFRLSGIDVDRGFWGVTWNPDGTVTWYDN